MAQITISGSLTVAPASVTDATFPSGQGTVSLTTTPNPKSAAVTTGLQQGVLSSPNTFATLCGVGVSPATVTQGNFLYVRVASPMLVRVTTHNPSGPDDTATVPVYGTLILELDPSRYLVGLAVQGSGAVEWLVSGAQ